jgi:hypothetical protein
MVRSMTLTRRAATMGIAAAVGAAIVRPVLAVDSIRSAAWRTCRATYLDAARGLEEENERHGYNVLRALYAEGRVTLCRWELADKLLLWRLESDRQQEDIETVAGPWLDALALAITRPDEFEEHHLADWPPHGSIYCGHARTWDALAASYRVAIVRDAVSECGDLTDTLRGYEVDVSTEIDVVASRLLGLGNEVAWRVINIHDVHAGA